MKKAALFPFNKKLLPVARHFGEMQSKYTLTELITLPGQGLSGRDAADGCNQPHLGIQVVDKVDAKSVQWDTLILVHEYLPKDFEEQKMVAEILSCGKEVTVLAHSMDSVPSWMKMLYEDKRMVLVFSEQFWKEEDQTTGYEEIHTPILFVGGLVEEADVLEATVAATKALKDMGVIVETITKESAAEIFGFLDFEPIYSKQEGAEEKILRINHVLRSIEKNLVPDIIVVEAPDAVIRYNDIEPNGFGIQTYMFCQAVRPDYMVLCMPYDLVQKEFIEILNQDFRFRYGTEIGLIHASNVLVDAIEVVSSKKMAIFYNQYDRMEAFIKDIEAGVPICNVIGQAEEFGAQLQYLFEGC